MTSPPVRQLESSLSLCDNRAQVVCRHFRVQSKVWTHKNWCKAVKWFDYFIEPSAQRDQNSSVTEYEVYRFVPYCKRLLFIFHLQSGINIRLQPACSGQLWLVHSCLHMEHSFSEKEHTRSAHSVSWKNNDYMILCWSLEQIFSLIPSPRYQPQQCFCQGCWIRNRLSQLFKCSLAIIFYRGEKYTTLN